MNPRSPELRAGLLTTELRRLMETCSSVLYAIPEGRDNFRNVEFYIIHYFAVKCR